MLNVESNADEVSKWLETQIKNISRGINTSIRKITELAYESLKQRCSDANLDGHLDNITMEYDEINNVGIVKTSDDVIIFKEIGTGIVGKTNSYPSNDIGWEYDINEHGEEGWVYPKKDGTYGRTRGLPANHMFYDTFEDLKRYIGPTIDVSIYRTSGE